jgi:hypothetical protein
MAIFNGMRTYRAQHELRKLCEDEDPDSEDLPF